MHRKLQLEVKVQQEGVLEKDLVSLETVPVDRIPSDPSTDGANVTGDEQTRMRK